MPFTASVPDVADWTGLNCNSATFALSAQSVDLVTLNRFDPAVASGTVLVQDVQAMLFYTQVRLAISMGPVPPFWPIKRVRTA
jgi:hypothetical protein